MKRRSDLYIGLALIVLPGIFIFLAYFNGQQAVVEATGDAKNLKFFETAKLITIFTYPFFLLAAAAFLRSYFKPR